MAQEELDAREEKEKGATSTPPTTPDASLLDDVANSDALSKDATAPLVPDAASEVATPDLHLANDDGTDALEIDALAAETEADTLPRSEDMAVTESLDDLAHESPVAIAGAAVEDSALLDQAYELAEAAADHEAPTESPSDVLTGENEGDAYSDESASEADHDDRGEEDSEESSDEETDYAQMSSAELIAVLEKEAEALSASGVGPGRFKKADATVKEIRLIVDQAKRRAWDEAKEKYIAENNSEEGFDYRHTDDMRRLDDLIRDIRAQRKAFFQNLDKTRDQNLTHKAELLQRLRELVDTDDSQEVGAADMKSSWGEFKKIQEEWKKAGNVSSPHNGTLWATYNALIDRYFSNRNIYFELKELDRKKNSELKIELCEKIEALAKTLPERPMTAELLKEGNAIFEEYKHVGPAPREEQELLWQRFKESLDALYDARRTQYEGQKKSMAEVYDKKSRIYETAVPYTTFSSGSINEWNTKTRELVVLQDEWTAVKGAMPRDEGKQLGKKFWAALKTFFTNKSEFFKQLESKRDVNLAAKKALCEEVEQILATGEDIPANTQRVIELQKQWKDVGQVPEKFKNSIYARFKKACDAYFDQKRTKNKEQDSDFADNLAQKEALCAKIEKVTAEPGDSTLAQLNGYKAEWTKIGFVPRKAMQTIQKRYINAVNGYVAAIGKLSPREKQQAVLDSEVDTVKEGGDANHTLYRKESDIRRKVTQLENDIALWENNIEFFAKSKSADKVKAQFEEKIRRASEELEKMKHQLTVIQDAI